MADIKKELNDIKNAVYGREVRGSIHDGIKKINEESEESKQKAEEAHEITQDLLDETFDSAALEANFEQRLNDEIENLQPEWTGFKNDVTTQLAQKADKEEVDQLSSQLAQKVTKLENNVTYTVGETGDFETIREALENLSQYMVTFKNDGVSINLLLLSGFVVTESITLKDIDLSYITLSSEDVEVPVNVTDNFLTGVGSRLPNINVLFNMNGNGKTGIHLEAESRVLVHHDKGVKNAGEHGIHLINSQATLNKTIFTGAGTCGIRATQASQVTAMGADTSYAGEDGFFISRLSSVHANEFVDRKSKATHCGRWGVRCGYSFGAFRGAILTDNQRGITVGGGGFVTADRGADLSNNSVDGALCEEGSILRVPESIVKDCGGYGLHARMGGTIIAPLSDTSGCDFGVYARHGGEVIFDNSVSIGNGSRALYARDLSKISALNVTGNRETNQVSVSAIDGSEINLKRGNVKGIEAINGSKINIDSGSARIGEEDSTNDIVVVNGSSITATDALGGVSQTENNLTKNGVIFK